MPFHTGERVWKIQVLNREGVSRGLVEFGGYERDANGRERFVTNWAREWRGVPRSQHFETLYQWEWGKGRELQYYLLIHYDHEFTENDYAREKTPAEAARWLLQEDYDLPDELKSASDETEQLGTLTPAAKEIWDLLESRAASAKQLVQDLKDTVKKTVSAEAIKKRIQSIRATKRVIENTRDGDYYRPDAPPPEHA